MDRSLPILENPGDMKENLKKEARYKIKKALPGRVRARLVRLFYEGPV